MIRSLLVASLLLLTSCASTVRSAWRDWGNADLAGTQAPPLAAGVWLLPANDDANDGVREAPEDWRPGLVGPRGCSDAGSEFGDDRPIPWRPPASAAFCPVVLSPPLARANGPLP